MAENIAAVVTSLSIALIALSLWLMPQKHLRLGLAFGVIGLAGASASGAWRSQLASRVTSLGAHISSLERELAELKQQNVTRQEAWDAAITSIVLETNSLQERLRAHCAENVAKQPAPAPPLEHFKLIEFLLLTIRGMVAAPCLAESDQRWLHRINQMMAFWVTTSFYELEILPHRELIAGLPGTYFMVRLKDTATGTPFVFPLGRHSLPDSKAAIQEAAAKFDTSILQKLVGRATFKIFMRGGADSLPCADSCEPQSLQEKVFFYPMGSDGKYNSEPREQPPTSVPRNEQLPNLRAAYFRSIFAETTGFGDIQILSNMPSASPEELARTSDVIVYVDW